MPCGESSSYVRLIIPCYACGLYTSLANLLPLTILAKNRAIWSEIAFWLIYYVVYSIHHLDVFC